MPLDEARQAFLDVFCHCYALLLAHLDRLDGAVSVHHEWDGYRLVHECVDPAANRLCSAFPTLTDRRALCQDFLRRIQGALEHNLPGDSPIFAAFSDYVAAVEDAPAIPCADLVAWQRVGEELSRACYCRHLTTDVPGLSLVVRPVELVPSAMSKPYAERGRGAIVFGFAANCFTFADYVNLPFFFLHEYLSHLHGAPTFSEYYGLRDHPFTEGWLLHCARLAYRCALYRDRYHHPLRRDHYVARYLQETLDEKARPMICRGHERACQFAERVGEMRFKRVTLLVANTPHDVFASRISDLHGKFVQHVWEWLRRVGTLSQREWEDCIVALDEALEGDDPVRRLMEWLIGQS